MNLTTALAAVSDAFKSYLANEDIDREEALAEEVFSKLRAAQSLAAGYDGPTTNDPAPEFEEIETLVTVSAAVNLPKAAVFLRDADDKIVAYRVNGHKYGFWLSIERDDETDLTTYDAENQGALRFITYREREIDIDPVHYGDVTIASLS